MSRGEARSCNFLQPRYRFRNVTVADNYNIVFFCEITAGRRGEVVTALAKEPPAAVLTTRVKTMDSCGFRDFDSQVRNQHWHETNRWCASFSFSRQLTCATFQSFATKVTCRILKRTRAIKRTSEERAREEIVEQEDIGQTQILLSRV